MKTKIRLKSALAFSGLLVLAIGLTLGRNATSSQKRSLRPDTLVSATGDLFQTEALKKKLQGVPTPDVFALETRSEPWAARMEEALRSRFRAHHLGAEFVDVLLSRVECRQSACRLGISVGPVSMETARRHRPNSLSKTPVIDAFSKTRGALATMLHAVAEQVSGFEEVILIFGSKEIDPSVYLDWVSKLKKLQ